MRSSARGFLFSFNFWPRKTAADLFRKEISVNQTAIHVRDAYKVFNKNHRILWRRNIKDGQNAETVAVDHVSFQVKRSEIFGVLGPNGSGKSTLVRVIATLLLPDGGDVTILGHDVVREPIKVQRLINRVSVEASFFKKLSPMENLSYAAHLYGLNNRKARQRSLELLDRLGLERDAVGKPVEEMSRGMQQKVAIARALLTRPAILLLDEPTTGLDPHSKREVQALVREVRDEHGTTVLLTTHDMLEADKLCDRIAIMDLGKLVVMDTPARLKKLVKATNGHEPTLEDVFLELTGKKLVKHDGNGSKAN